MESVRSILLPFLAFLLWALLLVQLDATSQIEEVASLMRFSEPLADAYVAYWFTWNGTDKNACAWVGVTCTANSTVESLDFSDWGLPHPGNLSDLSTLPDLRQIDMSYNDFGGGPLLDTIGDLTQISRLDLSHSRFGGPIPPSISACRSLTYLSLEGNNFTGTIPDLSGMVALQFLKLADNQLSGSFPSGLAQMSNLVTIDISRNQLNGTMPPVWNSSALRTVYLDSNSIVGYEETMHINAPNLQLLSMSGNQLQGKLPLALTHLPQLMILNMASNNLSGTIPFGLYNTTRPNFKLDLSHNRLSGPIPADLLEPSQYPETFFILLSDNLLNGSIPVPVAPVYNTTVILDFSNNQLTGNVPSTLTSCQSLNLENNFLTGDIAEVFTTSSQGFALKRPRGSRAIEVYLGNNKLSGDLAKITAQWSNWTLHFLDLSNNDLSWTTSESFPDPIGTALSNMPPSLRRLSLAGNKFLGTPLPSSIGDKSILNVLDLSNSQLKGTISGDVFSTTWMPALEVLNLSHNSATGPIPQIIFNISSLTVLDLSYNMLSGQVPFIPQNSPLDDIRFFEANTALCGSPLATCPGPSQRKGVPRWTYLILAGSLMIIAGSCLGVTWMWRAYHELHEQDEDLIRTLLEREKVTLMPMKSLKKVTNNFAESAKIGEGGCGTVYKGKLDDGTVVAIKRSKREGSQKDKEQFLNEVRILSQVYHQHLVKLMGCCMQNKVALLVFEFISNGTLEDHLHGKHGDCHLSWKQRLDIAVQTADALNYLHSGTIYHRDVKSSNILLNDDFSAKVADFGISRLAPSKVTHVSTKVQGTFGYMDPEWWTSAQLTEKSDVFSFGVVLLELISAKLPIDYKRVGDQASLAIFACPFIERENLEQLIDPTLMETYWEKNGNGKKSIMDVARLARRCVEMKSHARPNMKEVLKELQDVCNRFEGKFMLDVDQDHEILLSLLASSCNSFDDFKEDYSASFELAQFFHPRCSPQR